MQFTDRQHASIAQVEILLNRLACDIAIGAPAGGVDLVQQTFAELAGELRGMDVAVLGALADALDARARTVDVDGLPALHQFVSDAWTAWSRAGDEASDDERLTLADDADAAAATVAVAAADAEPMVVPPPRLHLAAPAPAEPVTVVAAPVQAAAPGDDEDLVVLATDPEMTSMFVAEALDHLGTIEATILELEAAPQDKRLLDDVFRPFHTIKGNAGALGVASVQTFAHGVENLLDLARAGKHRMGPEDCEIVLQAVDVLTTMIGELPSRCAGQPPADTRAICARLLDRIERRLAGEVDEPAAAVAADAPPLEAATDEPIAETRQRRTEGGQSVKVDTGKLDSLIDLVGELVIAQALIYEDPALQRIVDERLQRNLAQVRRITTDLQRDAMSMRLVPIKPTFQKLARLVRDLSKKSGKAVDLVLAGEDTELDRKVIEDINDPLMHMIRNSVDHGIESAEARRAAGKRVEGRLSLSASHQGGNVVIAIADDGGGLNADKILRKAVERGLVAPGETLSPSEIHQLIFKPGFSTADQVTEISGRGVGMDVVRRNIEALRGRIDIHTTPGQGTTFLIKLPLTLAILDGLTLAVAEQRFVLPTFSVRESLRPTASQIHYVHGAPRMIQVRNQLMPLMWLADAFDIAGAQADVTQATVVVVEDDGRSVGLVVDALIGKQEVVVKSLGESFAHVVGVAGGAILGDGRVGLILDGGGIVGLLNRATMRAA
jgi:two-component system, chemotaxis family, sensor kinase CheA